jgi:NTP pyrophosphatase (non-canonical NTP hydrolase)
MEFKEVEKWVLKNVERYSNKNDVEIDDYFAMLKLTEEVGELAQAFLVHKKKSRPSKFKSENESKNDVAEELADVITNAITLANELNIDLEEALNKKCISKVRNK